MSSIEGNVQASTHLSFSLQKGIFQQFWQQNWKLLSTESSRSTHTNLHQDVLSMLTVDLVGICELMFVHYLQAELANLQTLLLSTQFLGYFGLIKTCLGGKKLEQLGILFLCHQ